MIEEQEQRYMVFKWLRTNYWTSLLVCLLVSVLGGSAFAFGISGLRLSDFLSQYFASDRILANGLFTIAFLFFISIPISIGNARFFPQALEGEGKISDVFYAFKPKYYWNVILVEAARYAILAAIIIPIVLLITYSDNDLATFLLWGTALALAMPPYYKYRFSPFILARYPYMRQKEVFSISTELTNRKRWRLFVIDLSFVALFLVGNLFFGIGGLLLAPYYEGVVAMYYLDCVRIQEEESEDE